MNDEIELYLEIDDDFKHIEFFDIDVPYRDTHEDFINKIRISVFAGTETIAYLECTVFYDKRIAESVYDHIHLADNMVQDAYDAMVLLKKCALLTPTDENRSLGELLTSYPTVTVYLHHIAVREDYRRTGIGNWLLRNLSPILQRNYSIFPRLIITLIAPQVINWTYSPPRFDNPAEETTADGEMYEIMKRLFEQNGYEQCDDTRYYITNDSI